MTVAGVPSVAELRDLVAAKDFEMAAMTKSYADWSPAWVAKDPAGYIDYTNDWDALQKRYASARHMADNDFSGVGTVIASAALDETQIPAADGWNAILSALKRDPTTISKGDLQDLYNRIVASGAPSPDFTGMPQPKKGSDADLNLLNDLGGAPSPKCDGFCVIRNPVNQDCILCIPTWVPIAAGVALILVYLGPIVALPAISAFMASRR